MASRADRLEDVSFELQSIVERLAHSIGRPVDLDDAHLRLLAHSSHPGDVDQVRLASILNRSAPRAVVDHLRAIGLHGAREPLRVAAAPELGMEARLCVPIRSGESLLGFLWLLDDGSVDPPVLQAALDAGAEAAEALRRIHLNRSDWLRRSQRLVLDALGEDAQRSRLAVDELRNQGMLRSTSHLTVAVLADRRRLALSSGQEAPVGAEPGGGAGDATEEIALVRRTLASGESAAALVPEGLLVLLCLSDAALRGVLPAFASARRSTVVGAATAPSRAGGLALARRRARWAAQVAVHASPHAAAMRWEELGPGRYLADLQERAGPLEDLAPAVCELARQPGGRDLLATVECFLDLAGSAAATAKNLSLHRSSLYHRLARAEELLGVDLHDGLERLEIHMAIKAARTQGHFDEVAQPSP